jgi:hypothetical protein
MSSCIYQFFQNGKTSFAYHVICEAMSQKCVACNSKRPIFSFKYFSRLLYYRVTG